MGRTLDQTAEFLRGPMVMKPVAATNCEQTHYDTEVLWKDDCAGLYLSYHNAGGHGPDGFEEITFEEAKEWFRDMGFTVPLTTQIIAQA